MREAEVCPPEWDQSYCAWCHVCMCALKHAHTMVQWQNQKVEGQQEVGGTGERQ